jgi:hypothetical protein
MWGAPYCQREHQQRKIVGGLFALRSLRASPAGSEEGSLFCVLTARLKPCPDTCMAGGYGVAVQADCMGVPTVAPPADAKSTKISGTPPLHY